MAARRLALTGAAVTARVAVTRHAGRAPALAPGERGEGPSGQWVRFSLFPGVNSQRGRRTQQVSVRKKALYKVEK